MKTIKTIIYYIFILLLIGFILNNYINNNIDDELTNEYKIFLEKVNIKHKQDIDTIKIIGNNILYNSENIGGSYYKYINIIYINKNNYNSTLLLHEFLHYIYNNKLTNKEKNKIKSAFDTMLELNIDNNLTKYKYLILKEYGYNYGSDKFYDELQAYYISNNRLYIRYKAKTDILYRIIYKIYFNK